MSALLDKQGHLSGASLQLLADGTLRGPDGMAARAHVQSCDACEAELELYAQLVGSLALLTDPPAPEAFTVDVLAAVAVRETQLVARRHIKLAAIPALAVCVVASLGWAFSGSVVQRFNELRSSVVVVRAAGEVIVPVVENLRLPLGMLAFALTGAILFALARTLRQGPRASQAALEA